MNDLCVLGGVAIWVLIGHAVAFVLAVFVDDGLDSPGMLVGVVVLWPLALLVYGAICWGVFMLMCIEWIRDHTNERKL